MPGDGLDAELRLKDRIVGHLQDAGTDSISGIARGVSAGLDRPVHRLTVAGYLSAMADAGELRVLDRPPSKHFQLTRHRTAWSLYQRVGHAMVGLDIPPVDRVPVAVAVLQQVLDRPVFRAEVRHTGLDLDEAQLRLVELDAARRQVYRGLVARRARPRIQLPRGDPLYRVKEGTVPPRLVDQVVRRVLLRATDAEHLAAPPEEEGVQARLDRVADLEAKR